MLIGPDDARIGNRAMASVLLLYYHLLREGGITGDQTVYLDPDVFDGLDFLDVEVAPVHDGEIDQQLLREGAVVCVLCDLNDQVVEYEHNFLQQPLVRRVLEAHAQGRLRAVPEADAVVTLLMAGEQAFDDSRYRDLLAQVFHRRVVARMRDWLPAAAFGPA
jgi:hypothetical protein